MIALIDYGAGNLTSVKKALTALGAGFTVPAAPHDLNAAAGADRSWRRTFCGHARARCAPGATQYPVRCAQARPLLGICLGMQWLYEGSEEEPELPGLGALAGQCRLLSGNQAERLKIPHVGWNALETPKSSRLLAGLRSGTYVYFTHSFAAPVTDDCVAATTHAERFAAAVERDNVFGVQFHPEKSGDAGLQILRNFLECCRTC